MNQTNAAEARLEADGGSEVPRSRGVGNLKPVFPHTANILSILSSCPCLAPPLLVLASAFIRVDLRFPLRDAIALTGLGGSDRWLFCCTF